VSEVASLFEAPKLAPVNIPSINISPHILAVQSFPLRV
jgi:hypothetical protein